MKIDSKNPKNIPSLKAIKNLGKSISALDAILCVEPEYRYYNYSKDYLGKYDLFLTDNGQGDILQVFLGDCDGLINGFYHELYDYELDYPTTQGLSQGISKEYIDLLQQDIITSLGSTFLIWLDPLNNWTTTDVILQEDGSEDLLDIMDLKAQTYWNFAKEYYELDIDLALVEDIYKGRELTKQMVLELNPELEDFKALEKDLQQIGYPYHF